VGKSDWTKEGMVRRVGISCFPAGWEKTLKVREKQGGKKKEKEKNESAWDVQIVKTMVKPRIPRSTGKW